MAQKTAVVRNTLATVGTNYTDFTSAGFGTPTAAIIIVCSAYSGGNPTDSAMMSIGFWDGANQRVCAYTAADNAATSDTIRVSNDAYGAVIVAGVDGASSSYYTVSSAGVTDGIRLTMSVDNTNAARYATVILFSGVSAKIGQIVANATQNATQESASLGFAPKLVFFTSIGSGSVDVAAAAGLLSFGFASNEPMHRAILLGSTDNAADAKVSQQFSETRCVGQLYDDTYAWGGEVTTFGSDTFTLTTRDGGSSSDYAFFLALGGTDLSFDSGTLTTPTSTSTVATTTSIPPETVLLYLGTATGTTMETGADANGVMIGLADATNEYSHSVYDEDAAATSNTGSVASDANFVNLDSSASGTRSDLVTGTVAFDTDSFDITYSAVSATARKGWWVAFGAGTGTTTERTVAARLRARGADTVAPIRAETVAGRVKAKATNTVEHIDAGAVSRTIAGRTRARGAATTLAIRNTSIVGQVKARAADTVTSTRLTLAAGRIKTRAAVTSAPVVAGMVTTTAAGRLRARGNTTTAPTRAEAIAGRVTARGTDTANSIRAAVAAGRVRAKGAIAAGPYVPPTLPVDVPESSRTIAAQTARLGASPLASDPQRLGASPVRKTPPRLG